MPKNHQLFSLQDNNNNNTAVVIVCHDHSNDYEACLRSVSQCAKQFPKECIYVVDCSFTTSSSSSIWTLRDILDDNDLHMVNYLCADDARDPQAALQGLLGSTELMDNYQRVLLLTDHSAAAPISRRRPSGMSKSPSSSSLSSDTTTETSSISTLSVSSDSDMPRQSLPKEDTFLVIDLWDPKLTH